MSDDRSVKQSGGCSTSTEEATANWLTREEWNACYFLGKEAFFLGHVKCGLCEQVPAGMERLRGRGYEFERLRAGSSDHLEPVSGVKPSGEHILACGEVAAGAFDDIGRARDAMLWLRNQVPGVSTKWIQDLLDVYDRVHGAPP